MYKFLRLISGNREQFSAQRPASAWYASMSFRQTRASQQNCGLSGPKLGGSGLVLRGAIVLADNGASIKRRRRRVARTLDCRSTTTVTRADILFTRLLDVGNAVAVAVSRLPSSVPSGCGQTAYVIRVTNS